LKNRLRLLVAASFYYSGLVQVARWWRARAGRQLLILNYHRASGGDLRRHLLYLRQHYRLLPLETALEELYQPAPPSRQHQRHDRRQALALTFDDGYQDNYTQAFALAQELQVPLTLFLIPGYLDSGAPFWWLEGKRLVEQAQVQQVEVGGQSYRLDRPEERQALARQIDGGARYARSVAQRERWLEEMRQALRVSGQQGEPGALPLTWKQVREMVASGWVSVGAHTLHHPLLAYLADPAEVQREVVQCRQVLEAQLGQPVRTFAYPVGQMQHIGKHATAAVKQAHYDWALTTLYGFNTSQSDRYLLRRMEVDVSQHWLIIAAQVAGLWGVFSRLRWNRFIRKYVVHAPA
jgi:peptidoglycan/xylan/chitin deacetylase (PgdA/CDA1 family)